MSANRSVNDILADYVPVSLSLGLVAMGPGGRAGDPDRPPGGDPTSFAGRPGRPAVRGFSVSVPNFVLTPILIVGLSVWLRWLPSGGWAGVWSPRVIIPAVALAVAPAAGLAGYTRSAMLDVLGADYVRTARAKGVSPVGVIARHAFRNALIPVLTIAGLYLARVVTGSFFVETIAAVPGIGRYFVTSISTRDYPVMLGTTLLLAFVVASVNLIVRPPLRGGRPADPVPVAPAMTASSGRASSDGSGGITWRSSRPRASSRSRWWRPPRSSWHPTPSPPSTPTPSTPRRARASFWGGRSRPGHPEPAPPRGPDLAGRGLLSQVLVLGIGVPLGLVAGYFRGAWTRRSCRSWT
jgi:hypothetical protein